MGRFAGTGIFLACCKVGFARSDSNLDQAARNSNPLLPKSVLDLPRVPPREGPVRGDPKRRSATAYSLYSVMMRLPISSGSQHTSTH
jgi:hypothetical protein